MVALLFAAFIFGWRIILWLYFFSRRNL